MVALHLNFRSSVIDTSTADLLSDAVLNYSQSDRVGGAPTRQLNISLRDDVYSVRPVEPDAFQGFADVPGSRDQQGTDSHYFPPNFKGIEGCALRWLGPRAPLRLPGGSMQLLEFTLASDFQTPLAQASHHKEEAGGIGGIGRSPLKGR